MIITTSHNAPDGSETEDYDYLGYVGELCYTWTISIKSGRLPWFGYSYCIGFSNEKL